MTIVVEPSKSITSQTAYKPKKEYSFDIVAGKIYYIQFRIESGFYDITQVSPEDGKELIKKTTPAKS